MIVLLDYIGKRKIKLSAQKVSEYAFRTEVKVVLPWCQLKTDLNISHEELETTEQALRSLLEKCLREEEGKTKLFLADGSLAVDIALSFTGSLVLHFHIADEIWECLFDLNSDVTCLQEILDHICALKKQSFRTQQEVFPDYYNSLVYALSTENVHEDYSNIVFECQDDLGKINVAYHFQAWNDELKEYRNGFNSLVKNGVSFKFVPLSEFISLSFERKANDDSFVLTGEMEEHSRNSCILKIKSDVKL
ncbi:MAG: hypothetical protein II949_11835 [Prevotella sp.]|nr:hypothetical protein [Prevotella sp.]